MGELWLGVDLYIKKTTSPTGGSITHFAWYNIHNGSFIHLSHIGGVGRDRGVEKALSGTADAIAHDSAGMQGSLKGGGGGRGGRERKKYNCQSEYKVLFLSMPTTSYNIIHYSNVALK